MRIYFDFELSGLEGMDAHLVDLMLALKEEVTILLKPYEEKIDKADIFPFIRIIPGEFGVGYINIDKSSEELHQELIQNVNMKLDYEKVVNKISRKDLN